MTNRSPKPYPTFILQTVRPQGWICNNLIHKFQPAEFYTYENQNTGLGVERERALTVLGGRSRSFYGAPCLNAGTD